MHQKLKNKLSEKLKYIDIYKVDKKFNVSEVESDTNQITQDKVGS